MKFIWKNLRSYKKTLSAVLVLAAINQIFSLLDPQIYRLLIDNYASRIDELSRAEFFQGVGLLMLAYIGVALVSRTAKNFQDYYVNVITHKLSTKLYARSIAHSLSLPYKVFEDQRSGEILDKLQKARTDTQALITSLINVLFVFVMGILFVLVYAFWVHWLIGLFYFAIIPTLGAAIFFISKKIKVVQEKVVREQAYLAGYTTETIRNVELVKSLGLEKQEVRRLNKVNDQILDLDLQRVRLVRTLSFIQGTMINGLRAGIMFLMLWLMFNQSITLGEFFTLLFYSFFLFSPLAELGNIAEQYQAARASNKQLDSILKMSPEPKPSNAVAIDHIQSLEFKNVNFSYTDHNKHAVSGINLKIKPGETVAFVGPSGSGKSTIIKLLVRLYQPAQGQLIVNQNIDSRQIDFEQYRKRIGFVAQETQLFSGTIRENLLFVKPTATDSECIQALDDASVANILNRSSKGLSTKIGESGIKLSGGERQRLAIARALLREPDVLIFDEATSSLDSLTEKLITETIQAIEKSRPDMITILVAHRLSTIAHSKRIYVLEKGKIIEQGSHDSLVAKSGLYAALWRQQSAI